LLGGTRTEIRFMGSPMLVPAICGAAEGTLSFCVVDFETLVLLDFAIVLSSLHRVYWFVELT
jgi:hypothetical protein